MGNKRIRRISLLLVPIIVAMTVAPVSAAGGYPHRVRATGWVDGISQWIEHLYSTFTGFRPAGHTEGMNRAAYSGATAITGGTRPVIGESGSNLVGESGSNLTTRR